MIGLIQKLWIIFAVTLCVLAPIRPAIAQEYFAADVKDIKQSPQNFWARGIVFRDTLVEHPQRKTLKIDNRTVTRFETENLGELYAESEAVEQIRSLEIGTEYLFSGTVGQRGRRYYAIIRSVSPFQKDAESIPELMAGIKKEGSTNQFNRVFEVLNTVMTDIHKDLFGYATANNIVLEDMFGNPEHRDKVAASARTSLRRFEERSKTTSQEFFVSVIISMLALQYGYVEQAPVEVMAPESGNPADETSSGAPVVLEWGDDVGPESWDIEEPEMEPEPDSNTEPLIESEPIEAPEPELESNMEPQVEPAPEPEIISVQPTEQIEEPGIIEVTDELEMIESEIEIMDIEDYDWPEENINEEVPAEELMEVVAEEPLVDDIPAEPPVEAEEVHVPEVEASEVVVETESETVDEPVVDSVVSENTDDEPLTVEEEEPFPKSIQAPVKEEIDYSRPMRLR